MAECLEKIYGSVAYVGIDIDPELKYPKGAARVTFSTTAAFVHAIAGRYVNVFHSDSQKRVCLLRSSQKINEQLIVDRDILAKRNTT